MKSCRTRAVRACLAVTVLFTTGGQSVLASYNQAPGTDYLLSSQTMQLPESFAQSQKKKPGKPAVAEAETVAPVKNVPIAANNGQSESGSNSMSVPNPILATGSNLKSRHLSHNALQLANQLAIAQELEKLPELRARAQQGNLAERLELDETREHISEVIRGAEMDVNFVLAEIYDEQGIYNELVGSYSSERDKMIAMTNAISFGANGALWAVAEALDIPTNKRPNYSVSSGINGILAGIIPSIASAYTLKEVNGKKHDAPAAPNMLAKLFDRPTDPQIEYPETVWTFLDSCPAKEPTKKRREMIIDRWVADSNIPSFTNRGSQTQIDVVTASQPQKKSLTLSVLSARLSMLSQLASEVFKMNRMLDELEMVLRGQKAMSIEVGSTGEVTQ